MKLRGGKQQEDFHASLLLLHTTSSEHKAGSGCEQRAGPLNSLVWAIKALSS